MRKNILLVAMVLLGVQSLFAQQFDDLSKEVPFDKEFRTGTLSNGLKYYIRHNEKPEQRASFYLYQNVGALLEEDNQNGLAHFLEHMAFNGTKTFPGKSMLDMLERNGVQFGKDVNAYTAYNETVYNISRVPTSDEALIDSCLLILRDWCDNLSLDEEEIDSERGVISEEWRTRRNSGFRIKAKIAPYMFNGAKYADRDVIGSLDVIQNFKYDELRDFYHKWYRSDLQAIGIVGDFDAAKIEQKVIELFSAIPAVENPLERKFYEIADNDEPQFVLATDNEAKNVNVSMMIRKRMETDNSINGVRNMYVQTFFNALMNIRIQELSQRQENVPFMSGGAMVSNFVRGYSSLNISANSIPGKEAEAFKAIYTEFLRVVEHGFTQSELDRQLTNAIVGAENQYDKRDQISNETYCNAIKDAFILGGGIADAQFGYDFANEIISGITAEEVSAVANQYLTGKNVVYAVMAPEQVEIQIQTKEDIEKLIAEVKNEGTTPYEDDVPVTNSLLEELPKGGTIVSEKYLKEFRATEWTLSNGAKVIYRFADYQKKSITLEGHSFGGTSLYDREDTPSIKGIQSFANYFGIGDYDPITYKKMMTGRTASSSVALGTYEEMVKGASTPKDLEIMLQLVYMRFNAPRFDDLLFKKYMKRSMEKEINQVKTPEALMRDTLTAIVYSQTPRYMKYDLAMLEKIDFQRMQEIYYDRFSDASDFTFFIVGDVDKDELKPLVARYIGAIENKERNENWVDNGKTFPSGHIEQKIAIPMQDPKSKVLVKIKNDCEYSRENIIYQSIIGEILNLRYTESIRENEGGAYSVGVNADFTRLPQPTLSLDVSFDCAPERADYLKTLVYKELDDIKKTVRQEDLDKVVLSMKKNYEQAKLNNKYWVNVLKAYYLQDENMLDPAYFEDVVNSVTTKDIAKAAKRFLKKADVVDLIFYPEEIQ